MGAYPDNKPDTCKLCGRAFRAGEDSWLTPGILACDGCKAKINLRKVPTLYVIHQAHTFLIGPDSAYGGEMFTKEEYPEELENEDGEIIDGVKVTIISPRA